MSLLYRDLLKKASVHVRLGFLRTVLTAIIALVLIVLSVIQSRIELGIMAGLLLLISWLFYSLHTLSKQVFTAIEDLSRQFNQPSDFDEPNLD